MAFNGNRPASPFHQHVRGAISHFVWDDGRQWGDRKSETLIEAIERFGGERRDQPFLDFEGELLTFGELDRRSLAMANALRDAGVGHGETVAMLLDNSADNVVALCAIARLGAIWVPINTAFRGEFLRHQLADCEARVLLCEAAYLETVAALGDRLPGLGQIYVHGEVPDIASHPFEVAPWGELEKGAATPLGNVVAPTDIACLIYTSGTTGASKGCMVSHDYLCSIGRRRNRSVTPEPGDITWTCLPLFHIAALGAVLISNLLVGERVALQSRFSVSEFWPSIEQSQASSAVMLAAMLPLVAQAPENDAMRRCHGQLRVVTGVPLSARDRQAFMERFGTRYVNSFAYGQTEANLVTLLPFGDPFPPEGSMGPPSEDFDMMIADDDGRAVPIGETGELLVRPRQPGVIFSGYWRQPEATLAAMSDMWWHTGDFARMDADGYLYFVDRKKDYLRSRGENISSFEVESALARHPDVREVAFYAIAGADGHEDSIMATVVLTAESSLRERDLFDWAMENLPYFAVPRFIALLDELPKNPIGKVQKHELRKAGVTAQTWDAEAEGLSIRRPVRAVAS